MIKLFRYKSQLQKINLTLSNTINTVNKLIADNEILRKDNDKLKRKLELELDIRLQLREKSYQKRILEIIEKFTESSNKHLPTKQVEKLIYDLIRVNQMTDKTWITELQIMDTISKNDVKNKKQYTSLSLDQQNNLINKTNDLNIYK